VAIAELDEKIGGLFYRGLIKLLKDLGGLLKVLGYVAQWAGSDKMSEFTADENEKLKRRLTQAVLQVAVP
jgi:hypothetical protein